MRPDEFKMPSAGQVWRHYKNAPYNLYTVVGVGQDENGSPMVIYTESYWKNRGSILWPPLYVQPLGRFLSQVEVMRAGEVERVQRFTLENCADPRCSYLFEK